VAMWELRHQDRRTTALGGFWPLFLAVGTGVDHLGAFRAIR
jgi:hypothetical protein